MRRAKGFHLFCSYFSWNIPPPLCRRRQTFHTLPPFSYFVKDILIKKYLFIFPKTLLTSPALHGIISHRQKQTEGNHMTKFVVVRFTFNGSERTTTLEATKDTLKEARAVEKYLNATHATAHTFFETRVMKA